VANRVLLNNGTDKVLLNDGVSFVLLQDDPTLAPGLHQIMFGLVHPLKLASAIHWMPAGIIASTAVAADTIDYVTHTTSSDPTITAPATINAGDLLILIDRADTELSTPPTDVTPSGFTQILTQTVTNGVDFAIRLSVSRKIADGTEDGSTITGMAGENQDYKILYQFRASFGAISSFSTSTPTQEGTTGNPAQQTVAASGGTEPVLGIAVWAASGTPDPRTTSITPDHEITVNIRLVAHDYVQNTSPADYTIDMDDETDNILAGFYLHNFA
jgi:hypothetical protein